MWIVKLKEFGSLSMKVKTSLCDVNETPCENDMSTLENNYLKVPAD